MKVEARTKGGWFVDASLEELNTITGLKLDKYSLGDTLTITPNLALADTVAAKEAALNKKIADLKTALGGM